MLRAGGSIGRAFVVDFERLGVPNRSIGQCEISVAAPATGRVDARAKRIVTYEGLAFTAFSVGGAVLIPPVRLKLANQYPSLPKFEPASEKFDDELEP